MRRGPFEVLLRPLLTEKMTALRESANKVAFLVHPDANRIEIRRAIETALNVKVERVNVMNVRGKVKRLGRNVGQRPGWKKAVVTLQPGQKLEMYESA